MPSPFWDHIPRESEEEILSDDDELLICPDSWKRWAHSDQNGVGLVDAMTYDRNIRSTNRTFLSFQ